MGESTGSNTNNADADTPKVSFYAERCIRFNKKFAQCQKCVDICTEHALSIDQYTVSFDEERCTACGLCTAACPEEAFCSSVRIPARNSDGVKLVYFACSHAGFPVAKTSNSPDCIAALSLTQLIDLYLQGVRTYFVLNGDCGFCAYNENDDLLKRFTQLNRHLNQLKLPNVDCSMLTYPAYLTLDKKVRDTQTSATVNRRGFFRQAMQQASIASTQVLGGEEPQKVHFLADNLRKLSELNPDCHSALFSVKIDSEACTACSDCTRVCPHNVLAFRPGEGDTLQFTIDPQACTACRACEDICEEGAISVDENQSGKKEQLELVSQCCTSCGVVFAMHASREIHKLCAICRARQTSQDQKLYQVY